MKDTSCFRLKFGGKISYFDWHRCFLPLDHLFRLDNDAFKKDNIVLEGSLRRLSGLEITDMLDNLVLKKNGNEFVGYEKNIIGSTNIHYGNSHMSKRLLVNILMHNIDIMHQKCNIGENILSTYITFTNKTKDNKKTKNSSFL
jgi:hypothetical protein